MDVNTRTQAALDKQSIQALSRIKGEPEWLRALRLDAWHIYEETPIPAANDELWRRTSLKDLQLDKVIPYSDAPQANWSLQALPAEYQALLARSNGGGIVVQHNSHNGYFQLSEELAKQGVIFCDLDTAIREHGDLVRQHLMTRAVTITENRYARHVNAQGVSEHRGYGDTIGDLKFATLHGAFLSGGVFLYVPRNVVIDAPLHALTYFDAPNIAAFTHSLIILEPGASVKLIEDYASAANEPQRFSSRAVELILKPGSSLQYFNLQDWAQNVWDFSSQTALLDRDSSLTWLTGTLGSAVTKAFLDTRLEGPGANAALLGFFFGEGEQHFDQHTFQNHISDHATSDLLYKGALKDKGYSVFRGLIRVNPNAQRSDAYQQNRNLLLSQHSHADSIPELEIEANDVRCTHGATVGPIDADQVFYLMARGIERAEAEQLIVEGFFDPLLQKIPLEAVRDRLSDVIQHKITG
ncbi:MAG: Fe-S cluster assembly protein SufD [Anaerolineae bacterium]